MRKKELHAYAIVLDAKDLSKKVFFVPSEHALVQMFRWGEYFHGRSMIGVTTDQHKKFTGIEKKPSYEEIPDFLKSPLKESELYTAFRKHLRLRAVTLKVKEEGATYNQCCMS